MTGLSEHTGSRGSIAKVRPVSVTPWTRPSVRDEVRSATRPHGGTSIRRTTLPRCGATSTSAASESHVPHQTVFGVAGVGGGCGVRTYR
jgi:hypothetical protein